MILILHTCLEIPIEVPNCYTVDSQIIYSRDTKQLRLILTSGKNEKCKIFPKGVQFNLSLGNSALDTYEAVLDDFDYETTTDVYFDNVQSFDSVQYALLKMFDYGQYTQFEIGAFRKEMAYLQDCFTEIVMNVQKGRVVLDLTPRGLCSTIFDESEGILQDVNLLLQNVDYTLDKQAFLDNYGALQQFSVSCDKIPESTLQLPFFDAEVKFDIQIGGSLLVFKVPLSKINGQIVEGVVKIAEIGQWNNIFFVNTIIEDGDEFRQAGLIIGDYDQVHYRISFRRESVQFYYEEIMHEQININHQIYRFACDEMDSQSETEKCEVFYRQIEQGENVEIRYDIMFYKGGKFIVKHQTTLELVETCWTSAQQVINATKYCLQLVWNKKCLKIEGTPEISLSINKQTGILENQHTYTEKQQVLTSTMGLVCYNIGDENAWLRNSNQFYLVYKLFCQDKTYILISNKSDYNDYLIVRIVVFSSAILAILVLLIITVNQVMATMKTLKNMKSKGRRNDI